PASPTAATNSGPVRSGPIGAAMIGWSMPRALHSVVCMDPPLLWGSVAVVRCSSRNGGGHDGGVCSLCPRGRVGGGGHGEGGVGPDARVELCADGLGAGASGAQRPQERLLQQSVALIEGVVRREEEPDDGGRGGLCARVVDAEHAVHLASPSVSVP